MGNFARMVRELAANLRAERREERQKRAPARLVTMPHCKSCGTAVAEGVTFCDAPACQEKARRSAPRATIETGAQPRPPRGTNFAYLEDNDAASK